MSDLRIENFLYPYVRFLNASPSLEKADFYCGNTLVAKEVCFGSFSPYVRVGRGSQEFTITAAGRKNNVISKLTIAFCQGDVYTVAAVHSDGTTMAYGIYEPSVRKDTEYGHIRICHLSPDVASADILANGQKILGDINYLELSKYICISPGKYKFELVPAGGEKPVLVMPNQMIRKGKYNTLYVIGLKDAAPQIRGILSVDAASYNGYYL